MSNIYNEIRKERLLDEALNIGIKKGLEGKELDFFADKYVKNVDATCERLFGKAEFTNKDHMYDMMKQRFST